MERKIRVWLGIGAAVLVSGGGAVPSTLAAAPGGVPDESAGIVLPARPFAGLLAQAEGGEGGPGEGGGPVGGTGLDDYRLLSTDPNAFKYDAAAEVAAYGAL